MNGNDLGIAFNVYCTDKEDRVIPWSCPCCKKCWLFITSKDDKKNGACVFGGPYTGYIDVEVNATTGGPDAP